jgi:hypothetical protein
VAQARRHERDGAPASSIYVFEFVYGVRASPLSWRSVCGTSTDTTRIQPCCRAVYYEIPVIGGTEISGVLVACGGGPPSRPPCGAVLFPGLTTGRLIRVKGARFDSAICRNLLAE